MLVTLALSIAEVFRNIHLFPVISTFFHFTFFLIPGNIRLDEDVFKGLVQNVYIRRSHTSSKCLQRRLQNVLIKTNIFVLVIHLQDVFKMISRRRQDIFKTSSMLLQDNLQNHLQDILKTSSRHLQDILQRCLQDVFKTYQFKLFLLPSL